MVKVIDQHQSAPDTASHYGVIIIGAGLSGIGASIQLGRKLGYKDVMIYEKSDDIGGTWSANSYPGAGSDIPIAFYSYSFSPAVDVTSQWAGRLEVMRYLNLIKRKYLVNNIVFHTSVVDGAWSEAEGVWIVNILNHKTGVKTRRTCNVLVSATGALSLPNIPEFPGQDDFQGDIFHSARWDHSVSLKDKNVVIVGSGCSSSQIVPKIVEEVGSLTQVARSRQSVLRPPPIPDGPLVNWMLMWIPGLVTLYRWFIYWFLESYFLVSDIERGAKMREATLADTKKYIREQAPEKYWSMLEPDFEISAKRRVFDAGYYHALNNPKMTLVVDDSIVAMTKTGVVTQNGLTFDADVVVLSTGFKTQDWMYPLSLKNGRGECLVTRLQNTAAKTYQSTCISDFPNLFTLMGPNSTTGHSSVIFTTEAQITMMLKLIKPILRKLAKTPSVKPAPSVAVTAKAEAEQFAGIRKEMRKKVWEQNGGISWYCDKQLGLCTQLQAFSQTVFWWRASFPDERNFVRIGC